MKNFLPFSMLLAGAVASPLSMAAQSGTTPADPTAQRPNIILFLVDDMGWQETSVPFYKEKTLLNERYRTPNMERMAREGVKFMQAYACAISSPTRCSLMSGMNAARHRVTNWTLNYNTKTDASSNVLTLPNWNYNGIQPAHMATEHDLQNGTAITSFPEILNESGYYTIHCGKAHFGSISTSGEEPLNFGFDVNIGGAANGSPGSYLASDEYGSGAYHVKGLEEYYESGEFLTEALTQEALKAIQKPIDEGTPFYLYMSHYAIHTPYNADTRFTGNYTNVYDELLQANLNQNEINHAALIEGMDKSLGDIMDFLDENEEVKKNTIIIFMADNGGQGVGPRQGTLNRLQNYPARAGKGSAYEGGVHEPMMVYWPGNPNVKPGTENQNRVMIEDFFPTILELAGVEDYETVQEIDGKSFVDIINDPTISRDRTNIWHFPNLWGETQDRAEGYGAYSAIMKGDYHLIYFWETQEHRLYNIKEDIGEQNNLAASNPELVKQLSKELTDSLKAYDAQRPSMKSTGKVIAWPDEVVPVGEALKTVDAAVNLSTDSEKYYYLISDRNSSSANVGSAYYWTTGEHYGEKAIQVSSSILRGDDIQKQLFYFVAGEDEQSFQIMTYNGEPVGYVDGTTSSDWNNGAPDQSTGTVVLPYLHYGVDGSNQSQFKLYRSSNQDYYGIGVDDALMSNWGTDEGQAGVADMKWVVSYTDGEKADLLSSDNTCQFYFMPYDENSFTTYYKEGLITEASQIQSGDFVVLQDMASDTQRRGYLQFGTTNLVTNQAGINKPALGLVKSTFDGSMIFKVEKENDVIYLANAAGTAYLPANSSKGGTMTPIVNKSEAGFVLEKNSAVENSWKIKTATGSNYLNGNAGSPTLWTDAHPYMIYKVKKVEGETVDAPWFYLSVTKASAPRKDRTMQVGNDQGNETRIWTAPAMANYINQLWHFEESYGNIALVNMSDPLHGIQGMPEVGANSADAKYCYSATNKDYSFEINTGNLNEGDVPLVSIKRSNAQGWYMNASQSGKGFDVNEYSDPTSDNAGYWSPIVATSLTETEDGYAVGSFCAPYAVTVPSGLEMYYPTSLNGQYLQMKKFSGTHLPANTPVVLKAAEAGVYPMRQTAANTSVSKPSDNMLKGTTHSGMFVDADNLFVVGVSEGKASMSLSGTDLVPAFKAFLESDSDQTITIDFDGTMTCITSPELKGNHKGETYDLSGRKVTNPSKGVYIKDGQKVVIWQ